MSSDRRATAGAALAVLRRAVELIRTALFPYPDKLALVSKVGVRRDASGGWMPAGDPAQLRQDIEENLRGLGTERLAAVNLRLNDGAGPGQRFDDQLAAMVKARERGIAFVPFFPLGSAFGQNNAVLGSPQVVQAAQRLGHTPAQVALA